MNTISIGDKFQGKCEVPYGGTVLTWTKTIVNIKEVDVWTSEGIKTEKRVYFNIHWDVSPLGEVDCLIENSYMYYDDFITSSIMECRI